MTANTSSPAHHIAFIGGGNMASAIIGGLIKMGTPAAFIQVVEPFAGQRSKLTQQFGVAVHALPGDALNRADLVVWAVKPQTFKEAAAQAQAHTVKALHLSVAAGIRSDSIAQWLDTEKVVRAMPNTPALVGQGMTALFARLAVTSADRQAVEAVLQPTGQLMWLQGDAEGSGESQLDAVTALSGSGPAYVFYFLEAMIAAGVDMGLTRQAAHQLAVGTFVGASALAQAASEPPEVLRERVTSKGGTTYAALTVMENAHIKQHFMHAMEAARQRAIALGNELGTP
ncbi:MAG: pyrroline-5-carboxylate reductase [Polaromonas sp.]|nr:pyrroline-5-carboxylate reductase [Polaromonas sp.]